MNLLLKHPLSVGTEYAVLADDCCLNVRFKSVFLGYRTDAGELADELPPHPDDPDDNAARYYMATTEWANGIAVAASGLEEWDGRPV